MKKNIVKTMLKAAATTAMVAAMFVGGNKMEAKAATLEEYAASLEMSVAEVQADEFLMDLYNSEIKYEAIVQPLNTVDVVVSQPTAQVVIGTPVSHPEMLALINIDRAANGTGNLVWNADLEVIAQQRVIEVMANYQSPDYAAAEVAGTPTGAVAHRGMRAGTSENALWVGDCGLETAEIANTDWISSTGHHTNRLNGGWTQYAAASYVDPVTLQETWVEVFK